MKTRSLSFDHLFFCMRFGIDIGADVNRRAFGDLELIQTSPSSIISSLDASIRRLPWKTYWAPVTIDTFVFIIVALQEISTGLNFEKQITKFVRLSEDQCCHQRSISGILDVVRLKCADDDEFAETCAVFVFRHHILLFRLIAVHKILFASPPAHSALSVSSCRNHDWTDSIASIQSEDLTVLQNFCREFP